MGVAFPHGGLGKVIQILKGQTYMGWRPCSRDDAQRYADAGIATIAIDNKKVIIIEPDKTTNNLACNPDLNKVSNAYIKCMTDLDIEEYKNFMFFTYNYGHALKK